MLNIRNLRSIAARMRTELQDDSGQIAIGSAILVIAVFMVFAVAFDAGLWYVDHRGAQNRVDAAAQAAAMELPNLANAQTRAQEYLNLNGLAVGAPTSTSCSGGGWTGWGFAVDTDASGNDRVTVCERHNSTVVFSALTNVLGTRVSASARAIEQLVPTRYAIMVMDPDECQAFLVGGNSMVTVTDTSGTGQGGATYTRSSSTCSQGAFAVNGSGLHLTATAHDVNGSSNYCGACVIGTVTSPAPDLDDPFENLIPPALGTCATGTGGGSGGTTYNSGNHTLVPGTYCNDITVNAGAKVTVRPGVYVLRNSTLTIKPSSGPGGFMCLAATGTASCTSSDAVGAGAMFFSTCNPSPCSGGATAGGLDLGGGGGRVRLTGRSDYDGVFYWLDKRSNGGSASTSEIKIVGSSTTELNGHLYAYSSDGDISGGTSGTPAELNISIMANTLKFTGSSNVVLKWNPVTAPKTQIVSIVE